jgi:hypothetical protein
METNYYSEAYNEKGLHLSELSYGFLGEVAKWAKFLSILGFISIALMVIASFFMGAAMATMGNVDLSTVAYFKWLFPVIYIIIAIVYVFPIYYLYKFSINTRSALDSGNTDLLTDAFRYLKSHYKFLGIMMIIVLCIYGIALVGGIIVGIAAVTLS